MIFKALTILVLVAAILGGTGYFVYEFHLKPQKLDIEEKVMLAEATPTPIPDPSREPFEKLQPMLGQSTDEAIAAMQGFLDQFGDSERAAAVRQALGQANIQRLFTPGPDSQVYTVARGDSLARISSKTKVGTELLYRANNLPSINLQIGQQLFVPKLNISLLINRKAQTVTVMNEGAYLKEYKPVAFRIPGSSPVDTKVADKFVMSGEKRVAFSEKGYDEGERTIMLAGNAGILRSQPLPAEDGTERPMPGGTVLTPADATEIFLLVARGTPVRIE